MKKELGVGFITKKLKEDFKSLEKGKYESKQLHGFIKRAMKDLKQNPNCGIKIPRKLWPKAFVQKYKITNLWKYNLPNAWRLLYTIEADEVLVVSIILEWLTHKEYEKRFKY